MLTQSYLIGFNLGVGLGFYLGGCPWWLKATGLVALCAFNGWHLWLTRPKGGCQRCGSKDLLASQTLCARCDVAHGTSTDAVT